METPKKSLDGYIKIGPIAFSRNRFLLTLACIAAALFVVADLVGVRETAQNGLLASALAPQMVWAYLLLGLAAISSRPLSRAGYSSTAASCWIITISFLAGAGAYTLHTVG